MIRRFKIEDIIVQDASGVVFRAHDSVTDQTVAVRRFFPFGADGGGLQEEEQTAYQIAIERLSGISHPALRAVICGGCDPVDGMPFIATEWVEGDSLLPVIEQGPVSVEVATELVDQALEVSEVLSHVLAEEAVWVETELQTIVFGNEASGRRFTFWISPLKWLGSAGQSRGLESVATLSEELMGWSGHIVSDQAGKGLGGWIKWLKSAAATTTLHEAREMLAASIGEEPPAPTQQIVAQATKPMLPSSGRRSVKTPVLAMFGLSLVAAGLGGWLYFRKPVEIPPMVRNGVEVPAHGTATERANRRAAELAADVEASNAELGRQEEKAREAGAIHWSSHELLVLKHGTQVTVEGTLAMLGHSSSKKTLYLLFSDNPGRDDARGTIVLGKAADDMKEQALEMLIGKTIRITGKVNVMTSSGLQRPDIQLDTRAAIEVVPQDDR